MAQSFCNVMLPDIKVFRKANISTLYSTKRKSWSIHISRVVCHQVVGDFLNIYRRVFNKNVDIKTSFMQSHSFNETWKICFSKQLVFWPNRCWRILPRKNTNDNKKLWANCRWILTILFVCSWNVILNNLRNALLVRRPQPCPLSHIV